MSSGKTAQVHFTYNNIGALGLNLIQDPAWKAKEQSDEARYAHEKVRMAVISHSFGSLTDESQ